MTDVPSAPPADADKSVIRTLFTALERACNVLLVVFVAAMLVTVAWNVFGRVALGQSVAWADEAARFLFIWMIFLGAAVAHLRLEHVTVDFVVERLPYPVRVVAAGLRELLILTVLTVMLWGSVQVISSTFGSSALVGVPFNVINAAVPVSAGLMTLVSLHRLILLLTKREV